MLHFKQKINIFILLMFIVYFNTIGYASYDREYLEKNNERPLVYSIIINKLTFNDIENMANIKNMIAEGSIGLMNTRGLNGYDGGDSFAAMNGSRKINVSHSLLDFVNLDFEARKIYERRMGIITNSYEIGNLEINRLHNINKEKDALQYLGLIGETLHYSNLKTAVLGNADIPDNNNRCSCLLAADKNGLIDYGNVDNILIDDYNYPFGYRTDYKKLMDEIERVRLNASFIVIDIGDLYRLNLCEDSISEKIFFHHRRQILKDIDEFLGNLINKIDTNNAMLIITSPNSGEKKIDDGKLSPLIIWGNNIHKGVLTSQTTRWKGIVANIDFGPTVTNFLNNPYKGFIGHKIVSIDEDNNMCFIDNLRIKTNLVSRLRYPILRTYNVLSVIVMAVTLFFIFLYSKINIRFFNGIKILLIGIMGVPISLLLTSMFKINTDMYYIIVFISLLIILIFVVGILFNKHSLLKISGFCYFIILLDILIGGKLTRFSVIGYDPAIGARYFGIGNELVGVLLASSTIFWGFCTQRFNKKYIGIILMILAFVITIHPNLGANIGGAISIGVAMFAVSILVLGIKMDVKKLVVIVAFFVAFIITTGLFDAYFNPNPSHLGQMVLNIEDKGVPYLGDVISRKILINIKLIGTSIWGKTLYFTTFFLFLLIIRIEYAHKYLLKYKYLVYGLIALIFGNTVGIIVNDSGVVLAAIANIYAVSALMYVMIRDMITN